MTTALAHIQHIEHGSISSLAEYIFHMTNGHTRTYPYDMLHVLIITLITFIDPNFGLKKFPKASTYQQVYMVQLFDQSALERALSKYYGKYLTLTKERRITVLFASCTVETT